MRIRLTTSFVLAVACLWTAAGVSAQQPGEPNGNENENQGQDDRRNEGPPQRAPKLPEDEKLVDIYRKFVIDAEKLATDYLKNEQYDRAKQVYEEVLRLVPSYEKAKDAIEEVKRKQATAERKEVDIKANADWQDTGVVVAEGKPVVISANGTWSFRVSSDVSADGMEIPKELQNFNLGALVGMIDDGNTKDAKPFFVGSHDPFTARKTGRLLLRMYDFDPTDNEGKVKVTITGSFYQGGTRAPRRTTSGAR